MIESKNGKLILGIILDAVGYLSFAIPGIGEFTDVIWAPISGFLMTRMYKGKKGQIAGAIAVIEEALPGFDIIPSFTLMWIYTYLISKEEEPITETK